MRTQRALPVVLGCAAALALVGCSDRGNALAQPARTSPGTPSAVTTNRSAVPSGDRSAAAHPAARPGLRIDLRSWQDSRPVEVAADYLAAYQVSMRERRIVPAMVRSTAFQEVQSSRSVIAAAAQRGWTVPGQALAYVAALDRSGDSAVVSMCLWEPSVAYRQERTGRPVHPRARRWDAKDVKMEAVGDRWYVVEAKRGSEPCRREAP